MFILHHRAIVLDIGGYNCLGIINPKENEQNFQDFTISKIQVDVSFAMEISLLRSEEEKVSSERIINQEIKSDIIGKKVLSSAMFYAHPTIEGEEAEILKSVQIDKGIPINLVDEEITLKPGQALIIKAKPAEVNNIINITVNYTE